MTDARPSAPAPAEAGVRPAVPFNLARYCLAGGADPRKPALLVAEGPDGRIVETWTYGEIIDAVARVAGGFGGYGLARGERVLLRVGNTSTFPLLFFGAIAAGLAPIPTSTMLTDREVDLILADSGARLVVGDGSCAMPTEAGEAIVLGPVEIGRLRAASPADFAHTDADDLAFLVYTSGTSGRPKGVAHAQRVALGRRPMREGWYGLRPDDRLFHAGAFNWTYTLGAGLMDPWSVGATSIVHLGERPPQAWPDLLEVTGATLFAAVPSLYRRILKYGQVAPGRFPALRHGLTAGEALKPALHREWVEATGRPLYEALGMSEISTYVSSGPHVPTRPGSPGRPQAGRRIAVLPVAGEGPDAGQPLPAGESGVIAVHRSDPGLMLGYWRLPQETAAVLRGDWFLTGDVAHFDADGYLWYEGRADDQMNAFGYRVAPEEVERAIAEHASVAEVAVKEAVSGDVSVVTAFVVLNAGAVADVPALEQHAAAHLADYKRPRAWVFVEALPHTGSGKVLRRALRP
ncbi:AMP-binding protein [Xanthobacter dioxanivorans]|uniref:AMP-binding protein n=1 Tax=Xanthobacter dioxanivorans TaxID=2528964 RepID=A0A974SJR0_9HYPH|nr:AMP-binding protein [Xanthobacter dioxanivorans]QRG06653.1 AMP-binding protein [Xanthobacter dioxanivorans]